MLCSCLISFNFQRLLFIDNHLRDKLLAVHSERTKGPTDSTGIIKQHLKNYHGDGRTSSVKSIGWTCLKSRNT